MFAGQTHRPNKRYTHVQGTWQCNACTKSARSCAVACHICSPLLLTGTCHCSVQITKQIGVLVTGQLGMLRFSRCMCASVHACDSLCPDKSATLVQLMQSLRFKKHALRQLSSVSNMAMKCLWITWPRSWLIRRKYIHRCSPVLQQSHMWYLVIMNESSQLFVGHCLQAYYYPCHTLL